jgi:hypothetical protein
MEVKRTINEDFSLGLSPLLYLSSVLHLKKSLL